jgi:hypothetical protein
MDEGLPCPYCGELNALGSNVCSRCMKSIRHVTNPDRADYEATSMGAPGELPRGARHGGSWWKRFKRWLRES